MEYFIVNHLEQSALRGLPFLQRLVYIQGLKPYVDYKTGMIGIRRGVSYQSIKEELYIEPHSGIQSGNLSTDQLRRALKGLEKSGLIEIKSTDHKLIFRALLVHWDNSVQNKLAKKPHHDLDTNLNAINLDKSDCYVNNTPELAKGKTPQLAIPLKDNNYYIFLLGKFNKFWSIYPNKSNKQQALEAFQRLNPDEALIEHILMKLQQQIEAYEQQQAYGLWVPNWKYPANLLAQHCWEDEINSDCIKEKINAKNGTSSKKSSSFAMFWESCKGGLDFDFDADDQAPKPASNVIAFQRHPS